MSIITADFQFRLSGGAANADPALAVGGAMSSVAASTALDSLFDALTAAEALAGRVDYRCIYVRNANVADTMIDLRAWIATQTSSPGTVLAVGLGASAINVAEPAAANETTAPAGVVFSAPADATAALVVGNMAPSAFKALWIRRTTSAGAAATPSDASQLGYRCETT